MKKLSKCTKDENVIKVHQRWKSYLSTPKMKTLSKNTKDEKGYLSTPKMKKVSMYTKDEKVI